MTRPGPPWWRPFARRRWRRVQEQRDRWQRIDAEMRQLRGRFDEAMMFATRALGLQVAGYCSASELALPDGRLVPRQHTWQEIDADENAIFDAAEHMLADIAKQHGPGRVWTLPQLGIVHFIYDDGRLVLRGELDEQPKVRLRALYHHEADAFRTEPPQEVT